MIQRHSGRWAALLAVLALAGCHSVSTTSPTTAQSTATPTSATAAPIIKPTAALFYAKGGSLYVSEPAGTPGRKLTDGPADAQPAPSPDLAHVAFVRKTTASDYGGELWVLDLSPQLTPVAPPRRLVDPAALPHGSGDLPPMVASPRWSPTGQHIAFVDNPTGGAVEGGILLAAAANTGALAPRPQAASESATAWVPFAESAFAWAPDDSHIAWLNERSDVRPTDVNALAVGGESTPVATGTNASSVTYAKDGQTILFTNGEAPDVGSPPFAVHTGGIYSIATPGGAVANPPSRPAPLFTRQGSYYGNLAVLDSGAMAFTVSHIDNPSVTIQVLDAGSTVPRTTVTDVATKPICHTTPSGGGVCYGVTPPAWGAGNFVAYLDTSPERSLVVTDLDNHSPRRVDRGVDTFAWAPRSREQ